MDFNSFYQIELYLVDTPRTEQILLRSFVRKVRGFLVHPAIGNRGIFTEPYWGGMSGERDTLTVTKRILDWRFYILGWALGIGEWRRVPNSKLLTLGT
ncbi:hypothetical protein PQG02_04975 [Nostoc sp. UHCC 0926]|uniref:hypothetical protein n=1 Tax=unclassified Nostoc TaxID=2593658 RepID=UPI00236157F2|nr:hypothetical protein [Nostoc sp. UHCC 0926]WDD33733.1 hypothetical protein PQG02_04975 [Nostoc sp. UHCC 0926]